MTNLMMRGGFLVLAAMGLALVPGLACKKEAAPPAVEQAASPSGQAAGKQAAPAEDVVEAFVPSGLPEDAFSDALAQEMRWKKEVDKLEADLAAWRTQNTKSIGHFLQRFHELDDVEVDLLDTHDVMARHEALLRRILAARLEGAAAKPSDERVRFFCNMLFSVCAEKHMRSITRPSGWDEVYWAASCDRGAGDAPPVEDKVSACADFAAEFLKSAVGPFIRTVKIGDQMEILGKKMEVIEEQAMGSTILQWAAGAGPNQDYLGRLRDLLAKRHPEVADEATAFCRQRLTEMATATQKAVRRDLAAILGAQQALREKDLDGNGVHDYWAADLSGLHRLLCDGWPMGLIGEENAVMDDAPLGADPKLAPMPTPPTKWATPYAIVAVKLDAAGKPFAQDTDGSGRVWFNKDWLAYCAFPRGYGRIGRQTYLMDQSGKLWFKDTDGKPVDRMPANPAADGWTESETIEPVHIFGVNSITAVEKIRSGDVGERERAVRSLRDRPFDPKVVTLIEERLADEDAVVREAAATAVGDCGLLTRHWDMAKGLVPKLMAMLSDENGIVGTKAGETIGRWIAGREAQPEAGAVLGRLVEMLQSPTAEERSAAVHTLSYAYSQKGKSNEKPTAVPRQVIDGLMRLRSDDDVGLMHPAIILLGQAGADARPAVPALCKLLDKRPELGNAIVTVLKQIGPEPAAVIPALERLVLLPEPRDSGGPYPSGLGDAVAYLGDLGMEAAPALVRIVSAKDARDLRAYAADALARLGPAAKAATPALTAALRDPEPFVRQAAAKALFKITGDAGPSVDALQQGLRPDDVSVADVGQLGQMGPAAAKALPALQKLLKDETAKAEPGPDGKDNQTVAALKLAIARIQWPGVLNYHKP
jgi:HEAT repeat protein